MRICLQLIRQLAVEAVTKAVFYYIQLKANYHKVWLGITLVTPKFLC